MKPLLFAAAAAAAALAFSMNVSAQVGVAITVGQPGFYGQIDIGGAPPPQLLYSSPVVIQPGPPGVVLAPIYLHVPPGYERHWRRHCREYNACGRPVYFVRHDWYDNVYVPHYREHHMEHRVEERRYDDRRYEGHDHDRREEREHDR